MAVWFWKEAWWDLEGCFGGRLTKFNIYPPRWLEFSTYVEGFVVFVL